MEGASASGSASTLSDDGDLVVSFEDSSCPAETNIQLGLSLSLGLKGQGVSGVSCAEDCSSASASPSYSSSSRACAAAGVKRTADPMAVANGQAVGWPPVRTHRMSSMATALAGGELNPESRKDISKKGTRDVKMGSSMFVKVTMDGTPIGRKIDLNAHRSYRSLSKTLQEMFSAGSSTPRDGSSEFVLTYKDKEGDWMLVGDVPWGMFLGSVRRLRIMRT
ncbi:PREDICTED: auxin-responsive protein IAA11-like [Tarenaya hassleriana]|uniref:auxin-responsive protein IAA11-like n=1 Tax=Tarenaya hassleriana TaxID=28532 RepID=UPI00053C354A|nr:PREDICTED: auxin-responsive protein IAA11-like [Tarenaya hassleriana]